MICIDYYKNILPVITGYLLMSLTLISNCVQLFSMHVHHITSDF